MVRKGKVCKIFPWFVYVVSSTLERQQSFRPTSPVAISENLSSQTYTHTCAQKNCTTVAHEHDVHSYFAHITITQKLLVPLGHSEDGFDLVVICQHRCHTDIQNPVLVTWSRYMYTHAHAHTDPGSLLGSPVNSGS